MMTFIALKSLSMDSDSLAPSDSINLENSDGYYELKEKTYISEHISDFEKGVNTNLVLSK